jgi:hypothetical protein
MLILQISIMVTYVSISYQDFKAREVSLLTFCILYLFLITSNFFDRFSLSLDNILINLFVTMAVTSLLFSYYIIKYGDKYVSQLKSSIGLGDVLMIPAFLLSFSPFNMILVFILTLLLSLLYHLIIKFKDSTTETIPLAGIQSLILSIILITDTLEYFNMKVDLYPL